MLAIATINVTTVYITAIVAAVHKAAAAGTPRLPERAGSLFRVSMWLHPIVVSRGVVSMAIDQRPAGLVIHSLLGSVQKLAYGWTAGSEQAEPSWCDTELRPRSQGLWLTSG